MDTDWTDLPYEILVSVFSCLNKKDLLQCQITCNKWKRPAEENFYSEVKLKNTATTAAFLEK
jgi:hypothetical protein